VADTAVPLARAVRARGRIEATSLPGEPGLPPGVPRLLQGRRPQRDGPRSRPPRGSARASHPRVAGIDQRRGGTARRLLDARAQAVAASQMPKASRTPGPFRARSAGRPRPAATSGPGRHAPRARNIVDRKETSTTQAGDCPVRRASRGLAFAGRLVPVITTVNPWLAEARPGPASLSVARAAAQRFRRGAAPQKSGGSSGVTRWRAVRRSGSFSPLASGRYMRSG